MPRPKSPGFFESGHLLILGIYWDNGKENGNYYSILGIYWDNGKGNGNYYLGFRVKV